MVAGASASATGSLFQTKGGSFYLQINGGDNSGPWHVVVVEIGAAPATVDGSSPNYFPPTTISPPGQTNVAAAPSAPPLPSAPSTSLPGVPSLSPASADSAPARLTQDQSRAIVVVKGDVAEGTGFLVKTVDGPAVITNSHVVAANPNIKIFTNAGNPITILSLKGAVDRDLVMFAIKDDNYSYLDLDPDVEHTVATGDEVLTPGNGEGGEVVLTTDGTVMGVGPQKVEFSNPIYHGNSGGPIFQVKSGKVIGVVTQAIKVDVADELDKASFANSKSAITGPMRYFGFRVDSVPKWEPLDWNRFLNETTFLEQFHLASRCLDSYLNGAHYEKAQLTSQDPSEGMPNSRFYLQNDSLRATQDTFHQAAVNSDKSQLLDAQRELLMELDTFADADTAAIQTPGNFYSFDETRAKEEIAYRNYLKGEIDTVANRISDLGH